ncbi:MAG: cytochrome c [Lentisphaeria bacterium]|jgi:mono/diheme cytochrome c family protein|nr:cytochrome c [Lentisphaeria bacterium]MDP7740357.1 cytochrome c [Lentisphaeria bacterium]
MIRKHLNLTTVSTALAAAILLGGCYRGKPSSKPPLHVVPNMDAQPKYKAQDKADFFQNGSAMRVPPKHTIPRGYLRADTIYFTGKKANGEWVEKNPEKITMDLLQRGRERYTIYCAVCHDDAGYGKGMITKRSPDLMPVSYHTNVLRQQADGYLFDIITNGSLSKLMGPYKHQVGVRDRWAIVAYVRALQRSQHAAAKDVPLDKN